MRRPSTYRELHAWWAAAVSGADVERHDGIAHAGFYKRRLVKGGPWVPVRILVERDIDIHTGELLGPEWFVMEVEGLRVDDDPADAMSWLTPIDRKTFDWLMDYRLRDPRFADTRRPIDLSETPTPPQGDML